MIPSLVEQVIAARIPTPQETAGREARIARMKIARESLRELGNVTAVDVCGRMNVKPKTATEYLNALVRDGEAITWKIEGQPRMWGRK